MITVFALWEVWQILYFFVLNIFRLIIDILLDAFISLLKDIFSDVYCQQWITIAYHLSTRVSILLALPTRWQHAALARRSRICTVIMHDFFIFWDKIIYCFSFCWDISSTGLSTMTRVPRRISPCLYSHRPTTTQSHAILRVHTITGCSHQRKTAISPSNYIWPGSEYSILYDIMWFLKILRTHFLPHFLTSPRFD
jgi:hypothetical protein